MDLLREMHCTWQQVANNIIIVPRCTLWRHLTELGIPISMFNNISDAELNGVMELLVKDFPTCGILMMWGQLLSMNIFVSHDRVHESLARVSPQCVHHRRTQCAFVKYFMAY